MSPQDPPTDHGGELRWTEHLLRAAEAFARDMKGVVPDRFTHHSRSSIREALCAVRSLLDCGIEHLEDEPGPARRRKVDVE